MPAELEFTSIVDISSYLEQHPNTTYYFEKSVEEDSVYVSDENVIKAASRFFKCRSVPVEAISKHLETIFHDLEYSENKHIEYYIEKMKDLEIALKDCGSGKPIYIVNMEREKIKNTAYKVHTPDYSIYRTTYSTYDTDDEE